MHGVYAQAKKEMGDKVDAYFAKFEKENYAKEQAVKQGRMSVKDYNDWRMRKMATGKQYIAMRNILAKDLTNADKIAMKIVNQSLPDVYALNMNYGTYSIEKDSGINTSFTLYNHAAVEKLIKDKIFVACYWPNVYQLDHNEIEYQLAERVIPIPCDQRYGEREMRKIVSEII